MHLPLLLSAMFGAAGVTISERFLHSNNTSLSHPSLGVEARISTLPFSVPPLRVSGTISVAPRGHRSQWLEAISAYWQSCAPEWPRRQVVRSDGAVHVPKMASWLFSVRATCRKADAGCCKHCR
ncbi:hypothetical protein GQ54DRAFT_223420 [Martensiomyces pterosporus]|nr:hypothetical protein GQ54DRAFT_223420 [Martensiomyces pterosporus]